MSAKKLRLIDVAKSNPELRHFYYALLDLLTWSRLVSDGDEGRNHATKHATVRRNRSGSLVGEPFTSPQWEQSALIPSHCSEWAAVLMTLFSPSAAVVGQVGDRYGWMILECSLGVPLGLMGCVRWLWAKEDNRRADGGWHSALVPTTIQARAPFDNGVCLKPHLQTGKVHKHWMSPASPFFKVQLPLLVFPES